MEGINFERAIELLTANAKEGCRASGGEKLFRDFR